MRSGLLFCLACALLVAGGTAASSSAGARAAQAAAEPDGVLVTVRGQASVKRRAWKDYAPATEGAPLNRGDLLRVSNGSEVIVLCADGSRKPIPSGDSGVPCSGGRAERPGILTTIFITIFKNISLVGPTRSAKPVDVPLIVSPRRTKLLGGSPILRWTPPAGASSQLTYKVSVRSGGKEVWSGEVTRRTELTYPGTGEQALKAGETYRLVVTIKGCIPAAPGDCNSDKEDEPGRTFTLLRPEEVQRIKGAVAALRALNLEEELTQLLTAKYYVSEGLLAEAIPMMEELSLKSPLPAVEQALGDAYLTTGLVRPAERHYLNALCLARGARDVEGQAVAQSALGVVYTNIGNSGEALSRLQHAKELYTRLGDEAAVEAIRKQEEAIGRQQ